MADTIDIEIVEQTIDVEITQGVAIEGLPATGADNSMLVAETGSWVSRTIAQIRTILGLGSAAYTASTDYAAAVHGHTASQVTSDAFQTPVFANPLNLDATTYKDFLCGIITGNTTINLNNTVDGDAGMIELIIDAVGGYTVALGAMFTKQLGDTDIDTTANVDNFISYRHVGTDIVYTINQVE